VGVGEQTVRIGFFGPEGTFTHEALVRSTGPRGYEPVPLPTIYGTVMAVHEGLVERALVPIENSLEGSVTATLDALAMETEDVAIVGELVHPIRQCLIARRQIELGDVETVVSHPQASAQCARFIRTRLPQAQVLVGSSTADAVRVISERDEPWAAIGNMLAADLYRCEVLRAGIEDVPDNETRFVWLARGEATVSEARGPWKTAIVFWGVGAEAPGWLVRCLSEFASRDVNLTRIESRPRKQGLGRYMFFADLEGRSTEPHVREALEGLGSHVEVLRVLGSYPAA
jgi:prephenate dehydratase